jgi:hypothetical protein
LICLSIQALRAEIANRIEICGAEWARTLTAYVIP